MQRTNYILHYRLMAQYQHPFLNDKQFVEEILPLESACLKWTQITSTRLFLVKDEKRVGLELLKSNHNLSKSMKQITWSSKGKQVHGFHVLLAFLRVPRKLIIRTEHSILQEVSIYEIINLSSLITKMMQETPKNNR